MEHGEHIGTTSIGTTSYLGPYKRVFLTPSCLSLHSLCWGAAFIRIFYTYLSLSLSIYIYCMYKYIRGKNPIYGFTWLAGKTISVNVNLLLTFQKNCFNATATNYSRCSPPPSNFSSSSSSSASSASYFPPFNRISFKSYLLWSPSQSVASILSLL